MSSQASVSFASDTSKSTVYTQAKSAIKQSRQNNQLNNTTSSVYLKWQTARFQGTWVQKPSSNLRGAFCDQRLSCPPKVRHAATFESRPPIGRPFNMKTVVPTNANPTDMAATKARNKCEVCHETPLWVWSNFFPPIQLIRFRLDRTEIGASPWMLLNKSTNTQASSMAVAGFTVSKNCPASATIPAQPDMGHLHRA